MTDISNSTKDTKVAYLGPAGTYTQLAALRQFGDECIYVDCSSIDDVFAAVENNSTHYGVVPVENSTEGAINNTQDCLIDSNVTIVAEKVVSIEHNFLVRKNSDAANIDSIASHKQSLAQCRKWLSANYSGVKQVECASNAEAAKLAQSTQGVAAIAGEMAARIYDLEILDSKIQDQKNNSTRFLILASKNTETEPSGNDKTSLLLYTENKPGSLFRLLQPFEELQISLSKIETRPSKKEAWEYVFFIDFEGHVKDDNIAVLFERLYSSAVEIKVLGSYPSRRHSD
ncbi:MAG: prephenate dehydratase [SAR86 cluster bacterium]|uniref:Prephenate dehydratase n=1 Tax=SAR86 cluster bacterium TaxID=2030880 RepID=A0A2A5BA94_9GAMM|nr:MAG: prephenate dehydratase [SAR86 cluster bacterium]